MLLQFSSNRIIFNFPAATGIIMSTFYTWGSRRPESEITEWGVLGLFQRITHAQDWAPGDEHQASCGEKHRPLRRSQVNILKVKLHISCPKKRGCQWRTHCAFLIELKQYPLCCPAISVLEMPFCINHIHIFVQPNPLIVPLNLSAID